ncbi:MAG: AbrB/MazE/SpoVT family DNA-binding domain-containing protein [Pseudomonadota bacterium]|nr:AbrB/MazE/SpoVT family DNA-binding domain-containing protein [Pseudomonadota bacterium]
MKTLALRQIGNSQGIILEKTILELIGADQKNTVFAIRVEDGELILRPLNAKEQKEMIKRAAKEITQEQAPILKKLAK